MVTSHCVRMDRPDPCTWMEVSPSPPLSLSLSLSLSQSLTHLPTHSPTPSPRPLPHPTGDAMGIWRWNENIVFDISVRDVPRGARLCLAIYAVYGGKKKKTKTGKNEAKGVSS